MGQFPTNGTDGGGSLRPQRPTTVRQAREKRLRQNGVDPQMLRESMDRVRFSEDRLNQMAKRAALLRSSGRSAEAEGIVQQIRAMRDDPNRAAQLRQFGRDVRLSRGTVGDLPAEQQRANAASNERSMNDSLRAAYTNAGQATDRRREIIMARKAQAGRAAAALTLDGRELSDEQAAAMFDAVGPDVRQRVTRGVPIGDASRQEANEAGLARAVERGITLDRTPRAPRELDQDRVAQIRAEQAIERRRRAEANAAQNSLLDIAEDQRVTAVNEAEGAARASDTAGEAGTLEARRRVAQAQRDAEMARIAAENDPQNAQAQAEAERAKLRAEILASQNEATIGEIDQGIIRDNPEAVIQQRQSALGLTDAGQTDAARTGLGPEAQALAIDEVVNDIGPIIQERSVRTSDEKAAAVTRAEARVRATLGSLPTKAQQAAYARALLQQFAQFGDLGQVQFGSTIRSAIGTTIRQAGNPTGSGRSSESTTASVAFRRLVKMLQDAAAE